METVKGYAKYESETLERVIQARNRAMNAASHKERIEKDNVFSGKSPLIVRTFRKLSGFKRQSENFIQLQEQLARIEEEIAGARRYYNGIVNQFNTKAEMFPGSLIAGIFHFERMPLYGSEQQGRRAGKGQCIHSDRSGDMRIKRIKAVFYNRYLDFIFLDRREFRDCKPSFSTDGTQTQVVEDRNMTTQDYHTEIEIREDHSYLVSERIEVDFSNARHGIYRYIPQKGVITELQEDGTLSEIPYYASFIRSHPMSRWM